MTRFIVIPVFLLFSSIFSQGLNIRSTLEIQDGIVYNPDTHRPLSDLAIEYYDNGLVKLRGHYSKGLTNGYWTFYYDNGQMEARGRYYMGQEENLQGIPENG